MSNFEKLKNAILSQGVEDYYDEVEDNGYLSDAKNNIIQSKDNIEAIPLKMVSAPKREDEQYMRALLKAYEDNGNKDTTDYVRIENIIHKLEAKRIKALNAFKASKSVQDYQKNLRFPNVVEDDDGNVKSIPFVIENTEHLLCSDKGFEMKWNDMKKEIDFEIDNETAQYIKPSEKNAILNYLKDVCRTNYYNISGADLKEHVTNISLKNRFHPVANYFNTLDWDGNDHIDALFKTLEVRKEFEEHNEIYEIMFKRWLIMCVAAVLNPKGIAPQGVFILQGDQGIGKTSWLKKLVKDTEWFAEGLQIDPSNKDTVIRFGSYWIVELGELDGIIRKNDISQLKAFITSDRDEYRPPYAASLEKYERRTCMCGSVNDLRYLNDTENRRFWTFPVGAIEINHNVDIDQVWAQAVQLYLNGERYWLDAKEMKKLNLQNESFKQVSPLQQKLEDYGFRAPDNTDKKEHIKHMNMSEIYAALNISNPTKYMNTELNQWMITNNVVRRKMDKKFVIYFEGEVPDIKAQK